MKGEILDTRNCIRNGLSKCTPQAGLLESKLLSFLREIRLGDQKFAAGTSISNIKYNYPGFQNDNSFYPLHDQRNNGLAKYLIKSKTIKSKMDKFLFEPLIAPLTEMLSY